MDNNNLNFINSGFNSELQSQTTDTRSENSNINYHNANTPCDYNNDPMTNGGVFPASYTNTSAYTNAPGNVIISDLSQSYPTASSNLPHPPQNVSQYNGQNATQFIQNNSLPFNSLNMTNSSLNQLFFQ